MKIKERITYMDSLRGLAVLLMVQQHLQGWLWNVNWLSYTITWPKYPFMLTMHFLGWFAAPLFIILAGAGAAMMNESGRFASEYIKRGLMIIACGYLLNLITPNWFKPGSWYVLHTIGLSLIIAPVILRFKNLSLSLLTILIIFMPAFLQTWLDTPLLAGNNDMNNIFLSGGILRIAFVEGHFPVFPWLGFFIAGIILRRIIIQNKYNIILLSSISISGAGIFLGSLYKHGYFFATGGKFFRIFVPLHYFYPPLPPFILFIMGVALLIFYLFLKNNSLLFNNICSPLKAIGRSSLTWFIVHVFIFNQIAWLCGLYKFFNGMETLLITLVCVIFISFLSMQWQKHDFKYGIECFIKRFTL